MIKKIIFEKCFTQAHNHVHIHSKEKETKRNLCANVTYFIDPTAYIQKRRQTEIFNLELNRCLKKHFEVHTREKNCSSIEYSINFFLFGQPSTLHFVSFKRQPIQNAKYSSTEYDNVSFLYSRNLYFAFGFFEASKIVRMQHSTQE